MKNTILKFLFISVFVIVLGIQAFAQLPGIAAQNSYSYANAGTSLTERIANTGLITLYPTGGGSFDVPNVGVVGTPATEVSDTRVVFVDSNGTVAGWLGSFLYLTPSQINMICFGKLLNFSSVLLEGNVSFKIQKKVSGVWTDVSTTGEVYFEKVSPHTYTTNGYHNAALYGWNGSTYAYLKFTEDGQPNPRIYNGQPTVLAFFTNGAFPYGTFSICTPTLKLGGTINNIYLLSSFVDLGTYQQINVQVPSSITDNTTIQFGVSVSDSQLNCTTIKYGNSARIRNWQ